MISVGDRTFFLYVGTDKAGSTWIQEVLSGHSQCYLPHIKDVYYFDRYYDRGEAWYQRFFNGVDERHRAAGELSHDYLYSHAAALRIHQDAPAARIIISVREPVARAFSAYLFLRRHGLTRGTFEEALGRFPELVERGLYDDVVREYLRLFGPDQVHVILFDRIREQPRETANGLYRFLGLEARGEEYALPGKALPAAEPRMGGVSLMAKRVAVGLRHLGMTRALGSLKESGLVQRLLYRPYVEYPIMDAATRASLSAFFRDDVARLEGTLGVDLSRWRESWNPADPACQ